MRFLSVYRIQTTKTIKAAVPRLKDELLLERFDRPAKWNQFLAQRCNFKAEINGFASLTTLMPNLYIDKTKKLNIAIGKEI